jgi:hypothetical protein
MTPEERAKWEAWYRSLPDYDGPVSAGGWYVVMTKFPPPDTTGMTPAERDAVVAKWVEATAAFRREANERGLAEARTRTANAPSPIPVPAA